MSDVVARLQETRDAIARAASDFGRKPEGDFFPWERTDLIDDLKAVLA